MSLMLVWDFLSNLRTRLGDTQEPYLWEDDELILYLNHTVAELAHELGIYRYDNQEITTQVDVYEYQVLGEPIRVVLGRYSLEPVSREIIDADINVGLTGVPAEFCPQPTSILVYPIPDAEYTMYVTIRDIPTYTDADTIDFPDIEVLFLGCMYRALTKQDSEIFNGASISTIYQLYTTRLSRLKSWYIRDRNKYTPSYVHPGLL